MTNTQIKLLDQLATAIMLINAQGLQVAFIEHASHWVRTRIYEPSLAGDSEPHGQLLHECLISLDEDEYAPTLHDVQKLINDRMASELELVKSLLPTISTTEELLNQLLATIMLINAQGIYTAFFDYSGHVELLCIRVHDRVPDADKRPYGASKHESQIWLNSKFHPLTPHAPQKSINDKLTETLEQIQKLLQPATQQQSEQPT